MAFTDLTLQKRIFGFTLDANIRDTSLTLSRRAYDQTPQFPYTFTFNFSETKTKGLTLPSENRD